jgi:hypothetical protein
MAEPKTAGNYATGGTLMAFAENTLANVLPDSAGEKGSVKKSVTPNFFAASWWLDWKTPEARTTGISERRFRIAETTSSPEINGIEKQRPIDGFIGGIPETIALVLEAATCS